MAGIVGKNAHSGKICFFMMSRFVSASYSWKKPARIMLFKFRGNKPRALKHALYMAIGQNRHHLQGFSSLTAVPTGGRPGVRPGASHRSSHPRKGTQGVKGWAKEATSKPCVLAGLLHTSRYLPNGTNIANTKRYIKIIIYTFISFDLSFGRSFKISQILI